MTAKEVIKRLVTHDNPPRIGMDFLGDNPRDIIWGPTARLMRPEGNDLARWNRDPRLTSKVPWFTGELMMTPMGDIYGRLGQKTKGECVKGALGDGWESLETWTLPVIDEEASGIEKAGAGDYRKSGKYILGGLPLAIFSSLRDCRHMDNALMDTLLEPDNVRAFLDKIMDLMITILDRAVDNGLDGIMSFDDMGTQISLFFSPETFRTLFKPYYKRLADEIHGRGMDFFLHSCGKIYDIVPGLVEAGVDVFQFDQPELSGSEVWAREFGARAVFYCPVDIQKIMITGDRRVIEDSALSMVNAFKKHGGSLIAKDYPSWQDINVLPEWAQWARDVVAANAAL
ncbi:MAG: hypothetical protein LBF95_09320 [Treponema sp.]|jgi:hypothetical protein|nr:hypothetical protein [Treponema sp.]